MADEITHSTTTDTDSAAQDAAPSADDAEEQRRATRENARRVLQSSGVAEMLQTLNRQALQGRGWFE